LGESFEVALNSGTAKEAVPFALPPGTAGVTPRLGLSYDSGAGNGPVGLGWSLGTSTIQVQTQKGLPRYDGTERFLYDGAELVPLGGGVYRAKNETSFARVRRSDAGWEVDQPNGTTLVFGKTPEARVESGARIFSWSLERQVDRLANRIDYSYQKVDGTPYLSRVDYNGRPGAASNHVELEYEVRPDALVDHHAGFGVASSRRLKTVRVFLGEARYRRYALAYDATAPFSLLASVTVFGVDDETKLPSLSFAYSRFEPAAKALTHVADAPTLLPGTFPDAELADFDADGYPDIVVAQADAHFFYRNKAGLGFEPRRDLPQPPSVAVSTAGVELSDVDGNGTIDLVAKEGFTAASFKYYPNAGRGRWEAPVVFGNNPSFGVEDGQTRLVDLSGDRLPDAFRVTPSAGAAGAVATFWLNGGDGTWSEARSVDLPAGATALDFADPRVKLADFTGDGLLDLGFVRTGSVLVWPGMGHGRFDAQLTLGAAPDVGGALESRLQTADLDGDGFSDLLFVDVDHVDYWLLLPPEPGKPPTFGAKRSIGGTPSANAALTDVRLGDMNGNGSVDLVWFTPSAATASERCIYLDVREGLRPNVLVRVDNGLGKTRKLRYATSATEFQASIDTNRPWKTRLPFPVPVLAESTLEDGRGGVYSTLYRYADGAYDGVNREFRGFGRVEQVDVGEANDPTSVTVHEFDLGFTDEVLKGREIGNDVRAETGTLFTRRESTIIPRVYAKGTDGRSVTGAELREENTWIFEGTTEPVMVRQAWTYDEYGNALTHAQFGRVVDGDPMAGGDESLVERSYANDPTTWILGRLYEETTTDVKAARVSGTRRYYDGPAFEGLPLGQIGDGLLTREDHWVEGDIWIRAKRLRRDEFGNVVEELSPRGASHVIGYDAATHTLPVSETFALDGGRSLAFGASYAPGRAVVDAFTDANGAVTRFRYDALDRPRDIVKPGDTDARPTTTYVYELGAPLSKITTHVRPTSGEDATRTSISYHDGLGRTLATATEAEGGRWVVAQLSRFSRRGAVLRAFDPFFVTTSDLPTAEPTSAATDFAYDAPGRRIKTTYADGTTSEERRTPLVTELFDAEDLDPQSSSFGTPLRQEQDGLGRIIKTVERLAADAPLETAFTFDAAGRRTSVTNAAGSTTRYGYNGVGWMTDVWHPDAGHRHFAYDDDGNPSKVVDAVGNQLLRTFDALDRKVDETLLDTHGAETGKIRFHYDDPSPKLGGDPALARGKLAWVEDLNGAESHFGYDERGRPVESLRLIDGKSYRTSQKLDDLDRMVGLTFADGDGLTFEYNERGLLAAIPGVVPSLTYDARGLPDRREYANGVATTTTYDVRSRLKHIGSDGPGGAHLQDLTYGYNKAGIVSSIVDGVHKEGKLSASWTLEHDPLYRLTGATGPAGTFTYGYDGVGNILAKSDVGAYEYKDAKRPDAVTAIAGKPIEYDDNGSITSSDGRTMTYNARGELTSVRTGNGTVVEYEYDFEGTRTLKRVRAPGAGEKKVVYVDRFSEVRDGELLKYAFVGETRVARLGTSAPKVASIGFFADDSWPILFAVLLTLGWRLWAGKRAFGGKSTLFVLVTLATFSSCGGGGSKLRMWPEIFYLSDRIGSLTVALDRRGKPNETFNSDMWGMPAGDTHEPFGFVGAERDEDGLQYLNARYYDSKAGRFLTVDPGPDHASPPAPEARRPYSYSRNCPDTFVDPTGREEKLPETPPPAKAKVTFQNQEGSVSLDSKGTLEMSAKETSLKIDGEKNFEAKVHEFQISGSSTAVTSVGFSELSVQKEKDGLTLRVGQTTMFKGAGKATVEWTANKLLTLKAAVKKSLNDFSMGFGVKSGKVQAEVRVEGGPKNDRFSGSLPHVVGEVTKETGGQEHTVLFGEFGASTRQRLQNNVQHSAIDELKAHEND
jgi:RHS repeat-associated protein